MAGFGSMSGTRFSWVAAFAAAWLLATLLYLQLPPKPDQFDHGYVAWRLLEGAVPYRDFIDVNWPGVFTLHALAIRLFGIHMWTWRAFDLLLLVPALLCLVDLIRLAYGRRAALLAMATMPLMYVAAGYWIAGQKDMTAAQFVACALWLHVRAHLRADWHWQLGTGLALGMAVLNKPTAGALLLLLPLHAWANGRGLRAAMGHALTAAVALMLVLMAAWLGVMQLGASARDVGEALFIYGRFVTAEKSIAGFVSSHGLLWLGLFAACIPIWVWIDRPAQRSLAGTALPVMWVAGWISALVQHGGHGYHLSLVFVAMMGALAVALAKATSAETRAAATPLQRTSAYGLVALAALTIGARIVWQYHTVPGAWFASGRDVHLARFQAEVDAGMSMADVEHFVQRLQAEPDRSCVFFVGQVSAINLLAQRPQPTPFFYLPVIMNARPPLPMAERWNQIWADRLAHANCRYLLVSRQRNADWLDGDSPAAVALRQVMTQYREVGPIGTRGTVLLHRRTELP